MQDAASRPPSPQREADPAAARILIVEDEFVVACDLADTLEGLGYAVVDAVASGEEAVAKARALRPTAILMDIRLAGELDGIQAAAQIRSERDVPIVFLSAHSNAETLQRATATEPFGYLVKPFKAPELRCAIEVAIRKHATLSKLTAANRELEAFGASVAHDLHSPLRGIEGFSEILIQDHAEELSPDGLEHLIRVQRAARRMHGVIDDLLRLSRSSHGELHRAPVDASQLARDAIARLRAAEPERAVDVEIADAITLSADEGLLGVVFENLIGNAWKFTARRPRASIQVGTVRHGDAEACFVRDDGAGFDAARAATLFSAFQRFHAASEYDGTGLGLAIVHRIVHRHGGRIGAESAIDAGTTLYFVL
jgi:signal transduction histidine kinase